MDQLDIRQVQDSESLKVWLYRGQSSRLVISFWDGEQGGEPFAAYGPAASHDGRDNVLFLADPGRSWLNAGGLVEEIVEWATAFRRECGAETVMTMGQGMGGFMALAMPAFLEVDVALAFSPYFAVPDHAIPAGTPLETLRVHNIGEVLGEAADYYLIHGEAPGEAAQCAAFPEAPNLHQFILPGDQPVPVLLEQAGLTGEIAERAFLNQARKLRRALEPLNAYRRADIGASAPETSQTETSQTEAGA